MGSVKSSLFLFLKGVANVVPGVSGGTVAFIRGIYDELRHSIGRLPHAPLLLCRCRGGVARLISCLLERRPIGLAVLLRSDRGIELAGRRQPAGSIVE